MLLERENSLSILSEMLAGLRQSRGGIAIVGGEAGIGKTSLLREFGAQTLVDCKILWGGCEALFTPRTLGPLHDMASRLGPVVNQLFDQATPQDRLFPAVMNALEDSPKPTVMIFEDVHWADNATLDLIKYLGRRIASLKTMLVLSLRTDEVGADHPLSQVLGDLPSSSSKRIDLAPLSALAVEKLALKAGKSDEGLHLISAGNPFFVTELLAQAEDRSSLPRSVRDAVWSRLSRLAADERALLELISVVPGAIEPWLVKALGGVDADVLIGQCVDRGVLTKDGRGALRFRHELARQATLERLSAATQRDLHARINSAMAAYDSTGDRIPLSVRVHHASGAGDEAQVLDLAPRAARQAAAMGAHREAASYFSIALKHVDGASQESAAALYEDWSYEAGIALRIDDDIIAARTKAIELWRGLGRPDKVSLNLRWLSRLHWYRGESELAGRYIADAMRILEGQKDSAELAMVYSANSQMHMLHDRTTEAIHWGKKAIALAERFDVVETRIHALNNVGSAMLFSGNTDGKAYMEESLALALKHGFHEQAARAYTNYAEYGVVAREFDLAERVLAEGIAFDTRHDLDSWTYYLIGRQAQLRMEQGRLREAEIIARGVLKTEGQTLVMKLPAQTVLAKVCLRLGNTEADDLLSTSLKDALATGEQQNILPVRLTLVEQAYLLDDRVQAIEQLHAIASMDMDNFDHWKRGEIAVWWKRFNLDDNPNSKGAAMALPRQLELDGQYEAAGRKWQELGLPYEAALAFMQSDGPSAANLVGEAMTIFEGLGTRPALAKARQLGMKIGLPIALKGSRRGPYKAARSHPLGLTGREIQILGLIVQGMANGDIAKKLVRSQRTIEHHVSAVLGKMNAQNRMDVVLRLRNEPWLLPEH
jgi:DNA-binding CsgD family transcriptional regulator/tetratricopeptide (TPR) repeat protein